MKKMSWENQKVNVEQKIEEVKEKPVLFEKLKDLKSTRGIKILSYGNFSTGKTHFALNSPGPVYVIDTENGSTPLADKFPDANIVNICEMDNDNLNEKDDVRNLENFQKVVDYLLTIPDNEIGTIIVDSISDLWDWSQAYAKTKIFKIPIENRFQQQWDWQVPNKIYLKQLRKLINKNCNIIFCARAGEEYAGAGQPSGTYKPQCQKKTPYWVDIVLFHEVKYLNKQINFFAKIEKCRQKGTVIGKVIENPSLEKLNEVIKNG
jgi:hypothetical protein